VLTELALDLRWCWKPGTDELWRRLDLELWRLSTQFLGVLLPQFTKSDAYEQPTATDLTREQAILTLRDHADRGFLT
jgi:hypothetical protein